MRVAARILGELRKRLAEICPPELLQLTDLELFLGPSPHAPKPALIAHLLVGPLSPTGSVAERVSALFPQDVPIPPLGHGDGNTLSALGLAEWIAGLTSSLLTASMDLKFASGAAPAGEDAASLWVEFIDEAAVMQAAGIALIAAAASLAGRSLPPSTVQAEVQSLRQRWAPRRPSPESRLMIAAARAGDIPVLPVSNSASIWQFGWGARSELFWVTTSNQDGVVGGLISRQKDYQKKLFESMGLPTPRWLPLSGAGDLARAVRFVGYPCVVKPVDRSSGRGVTASIANMEVLKRAVAMARRYSQTVMIEAHEPGHDHRLMVVNGRLEMALRLDPPAVTGDGRRTVQALLDELNRQRARDQKPGAASQVPVDESLDLALASQGLTLRSVIEQGRKVLLRTNANRATGGTALNVLDQVHPQIRRHAELLAEASGFATLGIDYVTTDISKRHDEVGGGFLEINGTPGMSRAIESGLVPPELARLVIGPRPGRIPACLVVAPADQTNWISNKLLQGLPDSAGLVSSQQARIGATDLPKNGLRPNERVSALLRYRSLETLIIIWTEQALRDWGLPLDAMEKLIVLGSRPKDGWWELMKSRSKGIKMAKEPAEAVRLVEEWQKKPGKGDAKGG